AGTSGAAAASPIACLSESISEVLVNTPGKSPWASQRVESRSGTTQRLPWTNDSSANNPRLSLQIDGRIVVLLLEIVFFTPSCERVPRNFQLESSATARTTDFSSGPWPAIAKRTSGIRRAASIRLTMPFSDD